MLDINFSLAKSFPTGKWNTVNGGLGGGALDSTELMKVNVVANPNGAAFPEMPSTSWLTSISPVTSVTAPKYANTFDNEDILQSRPIVFDVSGAAVLVKCDPDAVPAEPSNPNPTCPKDKATGSGNNTVQVRQFTLNGRIFALNDSVGNNTNAVDTIMQKGVVTNSTTQSINEQIDPGDTNSSDPSQSALKETLSIVNATGGSWTNTVSTNNADTSYWPNPGYYQAVTNTGTTTAPVYSYNGQGKPSWETVTGITTESIINPAHAKSGSLAPGMPYATTGEEWILINNSDVGHPFHIHINPFFVLEVGQRSYETFNGKSDCGTNGENCEWIMRSITASESDIARASKSASASLPTTATVYQGSTSVPQDAIVGKWWDTIIVPAHGYVKVRYWMNVPNQTGTTSANIKVQDDFNKTGVWVYHCHILRHEDRGMMMPVITRPLCMDVDAGPIGNNTAAQSICPSVCTSQGSWAWNGQWTTTASGTMSVCGCCSTK